ncbi:MAG: DUF3311 domain-containing protein [Candidatus Aminicenantes bacterium]|nr:DUF3311 domain-containing protein [Candidatus Aminicenantes bacterium]
MQKRKKYALMLGAIPFLMLVFALPLVNRIHPVIFGLPFILFWILAWVMLTPLILFFAYRLERKNGSDDGEER